MGRQSSKEFLVFFTGQRKAFLYQIFLREFEIHEIFITADRSAWPVLKRNQAAKFLRNFHVHFTLYSQENYVFKWKFMLSLITLAQNTILRQQHASWIYCSSRKNTLITSVNVGQFYSIFTFRFSFWRHLSMRSWWILFESMFFWSLIQDNFTAQLRGVSLKYCFYFENSRSLKSV